MSQFGGVERPGPWETAGDHERRIRALEALQPCCDDSGAQTTYQQAVLNHPCTVHYWPCNEDSGDLIDRVGDWDFSPIVDDTYPQYGAEGPLPNQPAETAVVNEGLQGVSGAESRFEQSFTSPPFWTGSNQPYTIDVWAYLADYASSGAAYLLQAGTSGPAPQFYVNGSPGPLTFQAGGAVLTAADDFVLDGYHYLVARYDGTDLELFIDAISVDTALGFNGGTVSGNFSFLNSPTGSSSWTPWRGRGAQLAIYDCALSDEEIIEHYGLQNSSGSAEAGMVRTADGSGGTYWAFPTIEVEF